MDESPVILVVGSEKNPFVQAIPELEAAGYTVMTVPSAAQGAELISTRTCMLVLVSGDQTEADTRKTIQALRSAEAGDTAPVLIASNDGAVQWTEAGDLGLVEVWTGPVVSADLTRRMSLYAELCEKRRLVRELDESVQLLLVGYFLDCDIQDASLVGIIQETGLNDNT